MVNSTDEMKSSLKTSRAKTHFVTRNIQRTETLVKFVLWKAQTKPKGRIKLIKSDSEVFSMLLVHNIFLFQIHMWTFCSKFAY